MAITPSMINDVDIAVFKATMEAVKGDPKKGATVWTAKTQWKGGLKTEAKLRNFGLNFDEPEAVAGTDTTVSPHETVLACYGACLTVGISLNAALQGISLRSIEIDLEGHIDLPGFLGLAGIEGLKDLPGYHTVKATVHIKSDASKEAIKKVFDRVVKYSPVGLTLSRPVEVNAELIYNES
ncbi:MAG TPA: OsmC family protein [Nitrospirota bacterium]|nr:OsmC family protein [Nitrospirota bacterium]